MKLVFLHGWSFDARFWEPLHAALGHPEAVFLERGYTGASPSMTLPDTPYLAIAHSAGTLWFLAREMPLCRGIIAYNGFARFSQATDYKSGIRGQVLARMRSRLSKTASEAVTTFRQQFDPFLPCSTVLDESALIDGLDELSITDGREAAREWGKSLTAINGENDPLVSHTMCEAGFPTAHRETLEGGHLLPITAPQQCAAILTARLNVLK